MDEHAAAANAQNPAALLAAAEALAATGQFGGAVDAADEAAVLFRARAGAELARKAERMAAQYAVSSSDFRLRRPQDSSSRLTARERLVVGAAVRRESSKEIAERLGLSVRTVDTHLANAYRKLGVSGRAELRAEL